MSFEQLRREVNEKWSAQQTLTRENSHAFPLEEELKKGLLEGELGSTSNLWKVKQQQWKNCWGEQKGLIISCGYLELDKDNVGYKLKISHQWDESEWLGYILKNNLGKNYLWDSWQSKWTELQNVNFNNLTSFDSSEWTQVQQNSFKKSLKNSKK